MPYYRFTGKELDPETGLYYYGARYYDPVLSRWISADPIIGDYMDTKKLKILTMGDKGIYGLSNKEGGQEFNSPDPGRYIKNDLLLQVAVYGSDKPGVYRPANLQLYGYTFNRPTKLVDPLGLWTLSFDFYLGLGGGITIGGGEGQPFFISIRAGGGKAFGFGYNPEGTSPSQNPDALTDVGFAGSFAVVGGPIKIINKEFHAGVTHFTTGEKMRYTTSNLLKMSKPTLSLGKKATTPQLRIGGYLAIESTFYPENILPPNPIDFSKENIENFKVDEELSPVMRKCTKDGHEKCTTFLGHSS